MYHEAISLYDTSSYVLDFQRSIDLVYYFRRPNRFISPFELHCVILYLETMHS
jgi:hypothetical protein